MKTKQLIVRSAVTLVTTGLTLLSVGTSQASGRGSSGMRMSGGHGSMNRGSMRQAVSNRATARVQGTDKMNGRIHDKNVNVNRGSDDRGRGRHERGDDNRGKTGTTMTRGERARR